MVNFKTEEVNQLLDQIDRHVGAEHYGLPNYPHTRNELVAIVQNWYKTTELGKAQTAFETELRQYLPNHYFEFYPVQYHSETVLQFDLKNKYTIRVAKEKSIYVVSAWTGTENLDKWPCEPEQLRILFDQAVSYCKGHMKAHCSV